MRFTVPLFAGHNWQTRQEQSPLTQSSHFIVNGIKARKPLASDSFTSSRLYFGTKSKVTLGWKALPARLRDELQPYFEIEKQRIAQQGQTVDEAKWQEIREYVIAKGYEYRNEHSLLTQPEKDLFAFTDKPETYSSVDEFVTHAHAIRNAIRKARTEHGDEKIKHFLKGCRSGTTTITMGNDKKLAFLERK